MTLPNIRDEYANPLKLACLCLGVTLFVGCEEAPRRSFDAGPGVDAALTDASMSDANVPDVTIVDAMRPDTIDETTCNGRSRFIYLISFDQTLIRYDPASDEPFEDIGRVRCPDVVPGEPFDPNSHNMTVDRSGRAWLFDQGGALAHVDTGDATCTGTDFEVPQSEFEFVGATFVYDTSVVSSATPEERLVVSGGPANVDPGWSDELATIDTDALALVRLRRNEGAGVVLVTSSGDGTLWGTRDDGVGGTEIVAADPTTGEWGAVEGTIPVQLEGQSSMVFWGGRFYFFRRDAAGTGSTIHTYTPSTDVWEMVTSTPDLIIGSGVSTCAPVILI